MIAVTLKHARKKDVRDICRVFWTHKPWTQHVRKDYIERMVKSGSVIYQRGVVIVYHCYRKRTRLGEVEALSGDVIVHQIASRDSGNGAATKIFQAFLSMTPCDVYLCVREDNVHAKHFYEKHGMKVVGKIQWTKKGEPLPGLVYLREYLPMVKIKE